MLKKAVIPAAGLGTRLLPITKELPKEMLPIFFKKDGEMFLQPMLQAVFEQIYDVGFREFGFVVGRGKRAIEDHFTLDEVFIEQLRNSHKEELAAGLQSFYNKLSDSTIMFMNQPRPKGFGDAIHRAKLFTGNESFFMHAGDDLVFSQNNNHLHKLLNMFENYDADAAFVVEQVADPRRYGVIIGHEVKPRIFKVENVIEKPKEPPSNLAVVALYAFKPIIYYAIEQVKPDERGEIQLSDALHLLLKWGCKLYALQLGHGEKRIDIGTPETYLETLKAL